MKKATFFTLLSLVCCCGNAAVVSSTADSGPGSLRAVIASAANGDTITFAVTGAVTLTSGELVVNKDLIITGPGAGQLSVQRSAATGTPSFRIFHVLSATAVAISGLTVNNGQAANGGGLLNEGVLSLSDCLVAGNSATQSGGGINNSNTLTMRNCVISQNLVPGTSDVTGGGLFNQNTATIVSCQIISNSVTGPGANAFGGGIFNVNTVSITNSLVGRNWAGGTAVGMGGGIYSLVQLNADTTTIAFNSASGLDAEGGGVANQASGTVIMTRSTVNGNRTVSPPAALPKSKGGGIANGSNGSVLVESSTISGNIASVVPLMQGSLAMVAGGGVFNGNVLLLDHSTVTMNTASNGSGLFNAELSSVAITNSILAGDSGAADLVSAPSADTEVDSSLLGTIVGPILAGTHVSTNLAFADLKVGPLQNNGGPTFTHALLCGSPAINAGDNSNTTYLPTDPSGAFIDQRGSPRIVDGIIDIGSFEYKNTPPTMACSSSPTFCTISNTAQVTVTANLTDADGDPLMVVWSIDGAPYLTNQVPASAPPTMATLTLVAPLPAGPHQITAAVSDPSQCGTNCAEAIMVIARGDLYPIALYIRNVQHSSPGAILTDIYNGVQPGNFGWLTWAGSASEPTLVTSLTPPGDSSTYINPFNPSDHVVSVGDWVQGKPGVSNSSQVRKALNALEHIDITVPVWDRAVNRGNNSLYRVAGFARVRILNYQLPEQNRITARFLGLLPCQ